MQSNFAFIIATECNGCEIPLVVWELCIEGIQNFAQVCKVQEHEMGEKLVSTYPASG